MRSEVDHQVYVYSSSTDSVCVTAQPVFLDEQSAPEDNQFVWAYKIRIENQGSKTVQLLTRHWRITDVNGMTQEVEGAGVVGEQPILGPGEQFEYASYASLSAPSGLMCGSYGMKTTDGEMFDVSIPPFSLDSPEQLQLPN